MRKNNFIAAAAILAFSACNSNQTSFSDKEKDSMNELDAKVKDSLFDALQKQTPQADVAPVQGDIKEVYPTPIIDPVQNEQKPHHDPHQGPIKPPAETGKK
jgi:coenzyme F420-reducing hydrogenase gamma subunit